MDESQTELWQRVQNADAAYEPIPTFTEFSSASVIHLDVWESELEALNETRQHVGPEAVSRSARQWLRAASVDTGALEGLYSTDRGFTMSVATGYLADSQLRIEKGDTFVRLFESHLAGFDMALDIATSQLPLTESWLRQLHATLVSGQRTYTVLTASGLQDHELVGGKYKQYPNHVQLGSGDVHSYAPVSETPHEVRRLVDEMRSDHFRAAHPATQAAYAHYALSAIHPFPDGNGRVCRALASVFTLRATSLPLLVFADDKDRYLTALRQADARNFKSWTEYVLRTTLDTIRRATESLLDAHLDSSEVTSEIAKAFVSDMGVRHDELDSGSTRVRDRLGPAFTAMFASLGLPADVSLTLTPIEGKFQPPPTFRVRQDGLALGYRVELSVGPPIQHTVSGLVHVVIGTASRDAAWRLVSDRGRPLDIGYDEAAPEFTNTFVQRIDGFARRLLLGLAAEIADQSTTLRTQRGY